MSMFMWKCVNQRCAHTFATSQKEGVIPDFIPSCPQCGCPESMEGPRRAPGAKSSETQTADTLIRGHANRYNLSDMGQRGGTKYGDSAQRVNLPQATATYAPRSGFEIPFSHEPTSAWCKNPPKSSIVAPTDGARFRRSGKGIPTQVVASHKG